jgi:hypothetical protein
MGVLHFGSGLAKSRCPLLNRRITRHGGITVLSAFLMVVLLFMAAFAIDVGMMCVAKAELQRTADAAALAAADALLAQSLSQPRSPMNALSPAVEEAAMSIARLNEVGRNGPALAQNPSNEENGEIVVGELVRLEDGRPSLSFSDPTRFNSVVVRVKRMSDPNGQLPLFFGRMLGHKAASVEAEAQAAFLQDFQGFRAPAESTDCNCQEGNLKVLPFALDHSMWPPTGSDEYKWNGSAVVPGFDGQREVSLYPLDTGAGGNFGTVDIGSFNSNTPTLRRQIVNGLCHEDLEPYGGALRLDPHTGTLILSGDPGLKLGVLEPELLKIIGECRIIPLYRSVKRSGNVAEFTIDGFAAIRLMAVRLKGNVRYLKIQPCSMITPGGIPGPPHATTQIYSTVFIAQ